MTFGWGEVLVLIIVVAFIIALAFRTGYTRGNSATRPTRKPPHDANKHD
jgi:hypothetical protein